VEATVIAQTSNPATGKRFVDPDELICPGCGQQVRCATPAMEFSDRATAAATPRM
jgi:hypothetical protein